MAHIATFVITVIIASEDELIRANSPLSLTLWTIIIVCQTSCALDSVTGKVVK